MKIIVKDQEEYDLVARFLVSLCNDVRRLNNKENRIVEDVLILMKDSIEIEK